MKIFGLTVLTMKRLTERDERNRKDGFSAGRSDLLRQLGYSDWIVIHPPQDEPVEAMRAEWDSPSLIVPREMNPEMNVWGLYWRQA